MMMVIMKHDLGFMYFFYFGGLSSRELFSTIPALAPSRNLKFGIGTGISVEFVVFSSFVLFHSNQFHFELQSCHKWH